MPEDSSDRRPFANKRQFATTQWSLIAAAGKSDGPESRQALAELCDVYWYPIYAYVRRRVEKVDEAQDSTQAFFVHLLEKQAISKADPERGRFRVFLLTALKNFLNNEREKAGAEKRGGGCLTLSLDFDAGESRYRLEPTDKLTAEMLYERRWILTLLDQVLENLQAELAAADRIEQFEQLKGGLPGEMTGEQYEQAAAVLGITPAAAKQAAYRMRKRYRELFRAEVARTVENDGEVDDEIGRLLKILSS